MGVWQENSKGKMSKVIASERKDRQEVKEEYERKVCERLAVEERTSVSEVIKIGK